MCTIIVLGAQLKFPSSTLTSTAGHWVRKYSLILMELVVKKGLTSINQGKQFKLLMICPEQHGTCWTRMRSLFLTSVLLAHTASFSGFQYAKLKFITLSASGKMNLPNSFSVSSMQKGFKFRKLSCSASYIPKTKAWESYLKSGGNWKKAREGLLVVGMFPMK